MQGCETERKPLSPKDPFKNGLESSQNSKNSTVMPQKTDINPKDFCPSSSSTPGKENSHLIGRPYEKTRNNSDNSYDFNGSQDPNDGTDSGVEMLRAVSRNGSNSDRFTPIQSCGSSLVSYSSEPEMDRGSECGSESSGNSRIRKGSDGSNNYWKSKKTYPKTERSRMGSRKTSSYENEGTSESCSETSSTHETVTPEQISRSSEFKKSVSSRSHDSRKIDNVKAIGVRRSESVSRNTTYERPFARSHSSVRTSNSSTKVNSSLRAASVTRNTKSVVPAKSEVRGRRDDGRWSLSKNQGNGARTRVSSVIDSNRKNSLNLMSSSVTSSLVGSLKNGISENESNALDKYGTLPRRPKKKSTDPNCVSLTQTSLSRSNSVTREPSLNRAATLRKQTSKEKENASNGKSLPPYPRFKKTASKTIIYHEVSVQTIITSQDIKCSGSGVEISKKHSGPDNVKETKGVQTEGKERLKKIEEELSKQNEELEKMKKENEDLKLEKLKIVTKINKMLGHSNLKKEEINLAGIEELERHFQAVGLTVIKQQEELSELRHYKQIAHRDLEKSLAAQKNLLQQQQEIEHEYSELQDFLQAEKMALSESLVDTEQELNRLREEIVEKQKLVEQHQGECKHLVRICEQRRQENLSLEVQLAGLDQRSRDVLVQQGAAVSAAAVALSGLGARLDSLVEQLTVSCNITDKDLEDIVYHNEAYNQSEDNSPDGVPPKIPESSKRGESFLHVILGAIRNAAQSPFSKKIPSSRKPMENSEHLAFFDADTEPCLNFDQGLEENSSSLSNCTDYGSCSSRLDTKKEDKGDDVLDYQNGLNRSDSLQNLSDAILNRQMVEKNEKSDSLDEIIPIEVNSLVDQIIDVDNLVTKLLKVIRIVQAESDRCLEEIQEERSTLASQLCQEKLSKQKLECNLQKLQQELTDARSQLNTRIAQLEEVKAVGVESQRIAVLEMQKRFAVIDTALGALNSVQDMVNKCPPLAQLRQDLEDRNFENSAGNDVNANNSNENSNSSGLLNDLKRNGAVLTTAI